MRRWWPLLLIPLAGCVSMGRYRTAQKAVVVLDAQNQQLTKLLNSCSQTVGKLKAKNDEDQAELKGLRKIYKDSAKRLGDGSLRLK